MRIIKIDVDKNPAVAQRYQVRSIPTLALFRSGDLIWKQAGVQSKQQLLAVLRQHAAA